MSAKAHSRDPSWRARIATTHPFSVDEPHIGTDDVFLEGAGPWRVIDFRRTEVLVSDGNVLVVEAAA
jgi:hypothetical protein